MNPLPKAIKLLQSTGISDVLKTRKVVDVDFSGNFLSRIRDIAGANPIILMLTKVDLLRKETDLNCVCDSVVEATMEEKLKILKLQCAVCAFNKFKVFSRQVPMAAAAGRYRPIQSAIPGLGPIQIDAFLGGGKLYDAPAPGVHLHHRQVVVVHSEDLPVLAEQSRLRVLPFPGPHKQALELGLDGMRIQSYAR